MSSTIRRTSAAVGGGLGALVGLAVYSYSSSSVVPTIPAPLATRPMATIADVRTAEVLEPECDCAPLWECMQKEEGSCGLLEKQLRECVARNKRL